MRLLAGSARKIAIPFVVLSILGWILYVVGFGLFNLGDTFYNDGAENGTFPDHRADLEYFPYWCIIATGPVLFINTFIHLVVGRWYTGVSTHFFTCVYMLVGGGVLYQVGLELFSGDDAFRLFLYDKDEITNKELGLYRLLEWVGVLASEVFLTVYVMLWPFFTDSTRDKEY